MVRRPAMRTMIDAVASADPAMALVIDRAPLCSLRRTGTREGLDNFGALCGSVLYQQLAGAAAATIHRRFLELFEGGVPTPSHVLALPTETYRGAGLSGAKTKAITSLAEAVVAGSVDLDNVHRHDDASVVEQLSSVHGIGRWTAEMFLMFDLGRLDIWPTGDFGVRKGWMVAHDLGEMPAPKAFEACGDPFRPYRSIAAWYCWRAADG